MALPSSPNENLRRLAERRLLHPEPASREEVQGFLLDADECLQDARSSTLHAASRFRLAYAAAHDLALAALRGHDFRPAQGPGHRTLVFQVLEHTVDADRGLIVTLSKAHSRRNASDYEGRVAVSESEVRDLLAMTERLKSLVQAWFAKHRPDLL
jgi:uncharacterized protein (UPF0332 family)